jgi:hypothetical protein
MKRTPFAGIAFLVVPGWGALMMMRAGFQRSAGFSLPPEPR